MRRLLLGAPMLLAAAIGSGQPAWLKDWFDLGDFMVTRTIVSYTDIPPYMHGQAEPREVEVSRVTEQRIDSLIVWAGIGAVATTVLAILAFVRGAFGIIAGTVRYARGREISRAPGSADNGKGAGMSEQRRPTILREVREAIRHEVRGLEERLDRLDARLDGVEVRMDLVEVRLDGIGRAARRITKGTG